jgi:hypothetical protein
MKTKLLNLLLSLTLIVGALSSPALAQSQSLPEGVSTLPESVSSLELEALPAWARARPPATSAALSALVHPRGLAARISCCCWPERNPERQRLDGHV